MAAICIAIFTGIYKRTICFVQAYDYTGTVAHVNVMRLPLSFDVAIFCQLNFFFLNYTNLLCQFIGYCNSAIVNNTNKSFICREVGQCDVGDASGKVDKIFIFATKSVSQLTLEYNAFGLIGIHEGDNNTSFLHRGLLFSETVLTL